eukprot:CAMPEP_0117435432 /NCGR_PEP_ID=MMETSP0759-20121206/479_1 /TAXON_ID=63605 /ORGANISM="Percolomonas cosmopolitus, Strain WS" /LENGTH=708 /DNA_ID=CAMNT_0005226981 /DNA_START=125 /DNA_END=2251 /DNA_ORIENTATION=-
MALEASLGRVREGREQALWEMGLVREEQPANSEELSTNSKDQQPSLQVEDSATQQPYPPSLLNNLIAKLSQNHHNLPQALLIEVQHGEISMPNDEWAKLMYDSLKGWRRDQDQTWKNDDDHMMMREDEQRNHDPQEGFTNDNEQFAAMRDVDEEEQNNTRHQTSSKRIETPKRKKSSKRPRPTTAKKGSLLMRVSSDLKPKETIHNYLVRNSSHSLFNRISYSSLDFVTESYHSILVIIDSRIVPMEKIVQWLRVARKYHHRLLICTVVEVKRHDMFINALPNSLVADFHFELFKKSPCKREVIFSLINNYLIQSNFHIPFRLSHELFELLLDACTIRNDDVNYFATFITSVSEMMLSTHRAAPLVYYCKCIYEDEAKNSTAFATAMRSVTAEEWRSIEQLPSVRQNADFVQAFTEANKSGYLKEEPLSTLKNLVYLHLQRLFAHEELNVIVLDCFLAVWRMVRGHHYLYEEDIKMARFKYVAQRIILFRDFLKQGSFLKTTMMRAAIRHIQDIGVTYARYAILLDDFEKISKRHSEAEKGFASVLTSARDGILEEFDMKKKSMFHLESTTTEHAADNLFFSSDTILELLDTIHEGFVKHYTNCTLWELYYAEPIQSQISKQSALDETFTIEDWMNTTISHSHRLHLLYAHHSVDSALSRVFQSMRRAGTENAQYEEYLLDTNQEDSVELQRQWYALMRTVKGTGLKS